MFVIKRIILILTAAVLLLSFGCTDLTARESGEKSAESNPEETVLETPDTTGASAECTSAPSGDTPSGDGFSHAGSASDTSPDKSGYLIDIEKYWQYISPDNADAFLVIVNKDKPLGRDFAQPELTDITYTRADRPKEKMNFTAEKALCALLEEAAANGFTDITVTSGFRSYEKQDSLYNGYINQEMANGKSRAQAEAAVADKSARPGASEHHTGLCADMHNLPAADRSFGATAAGKWLAENARRFGFILRYPQGKENVTGYMWEPWHFRFVGLKHAEAMFKEGLCLEEYLGS